MYKLLNATAAVAMLACTGADVAQARTVNHKRHHSGYAATVYSQAPRASWPRYAPVRNVRGRACDMPDSTCSNSWRIND
jgi:hypothetical protein